MLGTGTAVLEHSVEVSSGCELELGYKHSEEQNQFRILFLRKELACLSQKEPTSFQHTPSFGYLQQMVPRPVL